jgi:colanic acid biosynthesis glycosyl transferase WcaI
MPKVRRPRGLGPPATPRGADTTGVATPSQHVVVVSQYFHPEVASTAQLLTDLAVELRRRGMAVSALTAQPSYVGEDSLPARETFQGVEIERIALPYADRGTRVGRLRGSMGFAGLACWRLLLAARNRTLLLVTNPPVLPLVGAVLKKLRGQRYVILVNDIYPDIAVRLGYLRPDGWAARVWTILNAWTYRNADGIVSLEQRMADRLADVGGAPDRSRIEVLHNWPYPD